MKNATNQEHNIALLLERFKRYRKRYITFHTRKARLTINLVMTVVLLTWLASAAPKMLTMTLMSFDIMILIAAGIVYLLWMVGTKVFLTSAWITQRIFRIFFDFEENEDYQEYTDDVWVRIESERRVKVVL